MKMLSHVVSILAAALFFQTILPSVSFADDPQIKVRAQFHSVSGDSKMAIVLSVDIDVPTGFILYSPTVITDGPLPLKMKPVPELLTPEGPWFGSEPLVKYDTAFEKNVEFYRNSAKFERTFTVLNDFPQSIPLHITGQICDHKSCFNQKLTAEATFSAPSSTANTTSKNTPPNTPKKIAFDPDHQVGPVTKDADPTVTPPSQIGLWSFILMAVIAGFGALLTPCVFPMIPITISFFSKYQNVSSRRNFLMAGIYAGSIIVVYTIPGVLLSMLFGAGSMQIISTHPIFNVFISTLLLFFGLNLIGLFELRLPSGLINKSAERERSLNSDKLSLRKQIAGVFFMAVTFTLVSFSCTVGFVGGWVLPLAARGDAFYPLIGMLAFSSAFALPFFALAVFPAGAQKLQGTAGDWMVAVKITFGVIELAAATKFLSNLDLHFELGLLTRSIALGIWCAVFLLGTLLILKFFQKPGIEKSRPGVTRIVLALVLLAFAVKSYTGIGNTRPMGGWIDGWLPPVPYPMQNPSTEPGDEFHLSFLQDDLSSAMQSAADKDVPLFVDFTGFQCANCRQMESNYFPRPEIKKRLEKMERVKLFTDGPNPVHTQQRNYQFERFNTAVLPLYVVLNPHTDQVLATFSSLANSEREFVSFLDKGLKKFRSAATSTEAKSTQAASAPPPIDFIANGPLIDFSLPNFLLKESVSVSSLRGTWVLINFWASFCAPCKQELKIDIPRALQKAPHVKLVTVAIESDETRNAAKTFIQDVPLQHHIHLLASEEWSESSLPAAFQDAFGLPASYLLNPTGQLVWAHNGSITEAQLDALFNQIK